MHMTRCRRTEMVRIISMIVVIGQCIANACINKAISSCKYEAKQLCRPYCPPPYHTYPIQMQIRTITVTITPISTMDATVLCFG